MIDEMLGKSKSSKRQEDFVIDSPMTKKQMIDHIGRVTQVSKSDVASVLDALVDVIVAHLGKKGPGKMTLLKILKLYTVKNPGTKERAGKNPFTGEPTVFKAKPACKVPKISPLKKLKELVND